jgi:hypothetical protein
MTDTKDDDLVKRALCALDDMQGRVDATKLQVFQECIDRIEELEAKRAQQDDLVQAAVAAALREAAKFPTNGLAANLSPLASSPSSPPTHRPRWIVWLRNAVTRCRQRSRRR